MRVSTEDRRVSADPGTTVEIHVDVVNNGTIIDGLTARLIGLDGATVRAEPALLPIFPDAEGRIALSVDVPDTQQAGAHPLTVEVVSHTTGNVEHADVDLDVAPRPALALRCAPRLVRARRSGRFVLEVANEGNVPLEASLVAAPGEPGVSVRLSPATLRVEPGATGPVIAVVRGPRMITGAEIDRTVPIELTARRLEPGRPDDVELLPELTTRTNLQLKQRPVLSRGLLTACILAGIVALWALVFLLGLTQVFASDPVTKSAPASYFPPEAVSGDIQNQAAQTPADALPKTGLVPPGVGGAIGGVVTAKSDGNPVGRILVEAYRTGRGGTLQPVSSAATQSDGSYTLAGLFPTSYKLKFSARGIEPVWFPSAKAPGGADEVQALAQGAAEGIDATVTGLPGSLSGTVDPGDSTMPVRTQVVARLLNSAGDPEVAAQTTTNAAGGYRLPDLVAPGTYELSFTAPGYQVTKVVQQIAGGEDRLQPSVLLSAGGGRIAGVVTDGRVPLGGVTVSTTVGGETVTVNTPTTGTVGAFSLEDLPTPGTYVVAFSGEGYGARTVIIDLEAGESRLGFDQELSAGTGSIAGIVRGPRGQGLGGVEVTVGGASTVDGSAPRTTTITTGSDVGTFTINDLSAPGTYTLTFSLDGFSSETRPVTLSEGGATVDFAMSTRLGGVTGKVRGPLGSPLVGATVTATNGTLVVSAVSSGSGGVLPGGGYLIPDLPPGWYSVTVTADGMRQRTALVRVRPGGSVFQDLRLTGAN